jgi:hypothetical protein
MRATPLKKIGLDCRHDFNLTKIVDYIFITNRPFGTFSIRLIDTDYKLLTHSCQSAF